jgi:hypothetical protein
MKLARLLEMPESDFESRVRELEGKPVFRRLVELGVVSIQPYSQARFAARNFGGWGLRTSSEGLPELLDGRGELAGLMEQVGQDNFEACFLKEEALSDGERAKRCGISVSDAARLREFVDRLYVQSEFSDFAGQAAPARTFSAVAGIELENGRPVLAFFNREIWKGRYRVNESKRAALLGSMTPGQARNAEKLLSDLEFLERRKSTLYLVLEEVVAAQAEYLKSRDPGRRHPLTQRDLAAKLEISPSVLNRLISNKSVRLPWGLEAPMKTFVPSGKAVLRDHLYDLARERSELSDEALRLEMKRLHGASLSRRSVAQYRKELGLGGRGRRAGSDPHS